MDEAFRNIGEKQVLQYFIEISEQTSSTFEQKVLGATSIDTVEPDSIETILYADIRDQLLNDMLAGRDTTAYCLT